MDEKMVFYNKTGISAVTRTYNMYLLFSSVRTNNMIKATVSTSYNVFSFVFFNIPNPK